MPFSPTASASDVSGQFRNEASSSHCEVSSRLQTHGLTSDTEQQNQMPEVPTTSSSQTHDFEENTMSLNTTELDDLLSKTYVEQNMTSAASCDSPCCMQGFPCHPTSDELKKTSLKQPHTDGDGQFRQCPFSVFSKFPTV